MPTTTTTSKKQLILSAKQQLCTCITHFSTFLWRPLLDYDAKPPNASFYGRGRGNTTTNSPFSFWTWIIYLRIQLMQERSPAFDIMSWSKKTRLSLKQSKFIFKRRFYCRRLRRRRRLNSLIYVEVVQWRPRNVQKSVMHVQSCCFANQLLFDVLVAVAELSS